MKETSRRVCKCKSCSKMVDLNEGRLLSEILVKNGLGPPKFLRGHSWICFECLSLNEKEIRELGDS